MVEGVEDEGILSACADHHKVSLDSAGISILPVEGKDKLPWLLVLCQELNIKTYVIFDADIDKIEKMQKKEKDKKMAVNKGLLKLTGQASDGNIENKVADTGCVWKTRFADEVKEDFGKADWDAAYKKACDEFSIETEKGEKKFAVVYRTVESLFTGGKKSKRLEELWSAIEKYFAFPVTGSNNQG